MLVLAGLAVSFLTVVLLINKRYNVGLALILGAIILSVTARVGVQPFFRWVWSTAIDPTTIDLVLITTLIFMLGTVLKETGALERMLGALRGAFRDRRYLVALIPSLIGLLSVPGGAVLSAPLINDLSDELGMTAEKKAATNMLFRHIWYPAYPLYLSIIVASQLGGVSPYQLSLMGVGAVLVSAPLAFLIAVWPHKPWAEVVWEGVPGPTGWAALPTAGRSLAPIFLILILTLGCNLYFPLALALGNILALANYAGWADGFRNAWGRFLATVRTGVQKGFSWRPALIIYGIMLFRSVLENSGAVNILSDTLLGIGIPLVVLLGLLPLLVGFVTGLNFPTVAITIPFFHPLYPGEMWPSALFMIFITSTVGYTISPLHLCLILTREFFDADLLRTYSYILPPVLATLVMGVLVALLTGLI
ncbi:MAG TPA: DUF401 family protein [Firmicutes bacterium]|nr:DUF401 family protein [Bacillota bacterium]